MNYTDMQDRDTIIRTYDHDRDGDNDVFYSSGSIIYKKDNYSKTQLKTYIQDAPRLYSVSDVYREFFDIKTGEIVSLPSDGQIRIVGSQSKEFIRLQNLKKSGTNHVKLNLF